MSKSLKRTLIIGWTLAVFYVHLGALINFHQHRIWKKALCPELIAGHRDKKQEQCHLLKGKVQSETAGFALTWDAAPVAGFQSILPEIRLQTRVSQTTALYVPDVSPHGLRAPPIS